MSQVAKNASGGGSGGTVTSFSFTDANGFTGVVTNPTTTPNLTLTTNIGDNQVIYASGGALVGSGPGNAGQVLTSNGIGFAPTFQDNAGGTQYTSVNNAMSPYTVTATDYFLSVDASAGPVTINLPDTTGANRQFVVKDRLGQSATNNITVKSLTGASTIDGQANYVFVDNYESLECLFHGTNYEIF